MRDQGRSMKEFRTQDGKRLRDPEEFIREQGKDPVSKVLLYNKKDKIVVEAWKNMRTKRTHITKVRRPSDVEVAEFNRMIFKEQILDHKENKDQLEVIIGGEKYVKPKLGSK